MGSQDGSIGWTWPSIPAMTRNAESLCWPVAVWARSPTHGLSTQGGCVRRGVRGGPRTRRFLVARSLLARRTWTMRSTSACLIWTSTATPPTRHVTSRPAGARTRCVATASRTAGHVGSATRPVRTGQLRRQQHVAASSCSAQFVAACRMHRTALPSSPRERPSEGSGALGWSNNLIVLRVTASCGPNEYGQRAETWQL